MAIDVDGLAERFDRAYDDAVALDPDAVPGDLTLEQAYTVQGAVVERRRSVDGPSVGYKIGFTSEAVRSDLGVDSPAYGHVLADTLRTDSRFETDDLVDPQVEPEIACRIGEDLTPPVSRLDALSAVEFVVPAVEVVDSRVRNWEVTAATAVADNALAARVLVGDPTSADDVDLPGEGVELRVDGERRATGTGAAVLGHPADAVAWLAKTLPDHGEALQAGDFVTTGSITEPIPVEAGETVVARFASLGTVVAHAD